MSLRQNDTFIWNSWNPNLKSWLLLWRYWNHSAFHCMSWLLLQIPAQIERRQQREWLSTTQCEAAGCTEVMQDLVWVSSWKMETTYYLKIDKEEDTCQNSGFIFLIFSWLLLITWVTMTSVWSDGGVVKTKLKNSKCFLRASGTKKWSYLQLCPSNSHSNYWTLST